MAVVALLRTSTSFILLTRITWSFVKVISGDGNETRNLLKFSAHITVSKLSISCAHEMPQLEFTVVKVNLHSVKAISQTEERLQTGNATVPIFVFSYASYITAYMRVPW